MMIRPEQIREVVDLTDASHNVVLNMSLDDAKRRVASGDAGGVKAIEGQFALLGTDGDRVRMARTLAVPMRYFIAKRADGPALVAASRIDDIRNWLQEQGLADQFHPSYTRMIPAHYITEVHLIGCPDPSPDYRRFFTPARATLPAECTVIGKAYVGALDRVVRRWLDRIPDDAPIGVSFSGGLDSGAVFLVTYHALLETGRSPSRLKAFTLSIGEDGEDLDQARRFLERLDLQLFHEPVTVAASDIRLEDAVALMEDYKPLDIQAGAMTAALLKGIRRRYPDWKYMLDGDGGDENLKDYPIEENPELTIRSVLNNPLLYHEGWGVQAIKHSLTYSGGLSRGCTRTFAPAAACGFSSFSPLMTPEVIDVSEGIPFIELTDWDHERLYALKGRVIAAGIKAITGLDMPVNRKRRFQLGAGSGGDGHPALPTDQAPYRKAYHELFGA